MDFKNNMENLGEIDPPKGATLTDLSMTSTYTRPARRTNDYVSTLYHRIHYAQRVSMPNCSHMVVSVAFDTDA